MDIIYILCIVVRCKSERGIISCSSTRTKNDPLYGTSKVVKDFLMLIIITKIKRENVYKVEYYCT